MAIEQMHSCGECAALVDEVSQLKLALEHRDLIGQAKGILMAREGFTADAAFSVLRKASQRQNRKLYEIATEIAVHADLGS